MRLFLPGAYPRENPRRRSAATVLLCALASAAALPVTAQAPQPAPAGDVIGVANFAHIVADLDTSLRFYRDVIGLAVTVTQPFAPNDEIANLGATEGCP